MKTMFGFLLAVTAVLSCGQRNTNNVPSAVLAEAQPAVALAAPENGSVSFEPMVHDFGDVSVDDGPLSCSFTMTNTGTEAVAIYEVVSSCGCTGVNWSREPVLPGQSTVITATYKNEDGALPFDKTLTVYVSGVKRPVILRLRGVVHEKKKALSELYGAEKLGAFGLKTRHFKAGTLRQGQQTSETATVANLGTGPLQVDFRETSPQLAVSVEPNPIPAGSTARLLMTITADSTLYGKNTYSTRPVLNGRPAGDILDIFAYTQADFSAWTPEQRDRAAIPYFDNSTADFGVSEGGKELEVSFSCTNRGKTPFHVYKVDLEGDALRVAQPLADVAPGGKGVLRLRLDPNRLPRGENVLMVSLTTNSPLRPVVNLFVAGVVR